MGNIRIILGASILLVSVQINAGSMSADLVAGSGDSLIIFDTVSGLDWLDIPLTAGLTYGDVESPLWLMSGQRWRHATTFELTDLFVRNLSADGSTPTSSYTAGPDPAALVAIIGMLGVTASTTSSTAFSNEVSGMYNDGNLANGVGVGGLQTDSGSGQGQRQRYLWRISPNQRTLSDSTDEGHFMVRGDSISPPSPVPAPPALLLFGTGLLGLIGFSKRRKAT